MSKTSTKGRRSVVFELRAEPGSEVFLSSSFNGWEPAARKMSYQNNRYTARLLPPPGRYEYRFVIDGIWCVDPECPDWGPNEHGSLNSVLVVD